MLLGRPSKLLLISAGNLTNAELEALLVPALSTIVDELARHDFIELGWTGVIARG